MWIKEWISNLAASLYENNVQFPFLCQDNFDNDFWTGECLTRVISLAAPTWHLPGSIRLAPLRQHSPATSPAALTWSAAVHHLPSSTHLSSPRQHPPVIFLALPTWSGAFGSSSAVGGAFADCDRRFSSSSSISARGSVADTTRRGRGGEDSNLCVPGPLFIKTNSQSVDDRIAKISNHSVYTFLANLDKEYSCKFPVYWY